MINPPSSHCSVREDAYCKHEHGIEAAEERVHRDSEGVAVGDFIVDNGLNVDGLQLEVDGHINQPGDTEMTQRIKGGKKSNNFCF